MQQQDINEVLETKATDEGVAVVTRGTHICAFVAKNLRDLLKTFAPEKYAEYQAIKYPNGRDGETSLENKREATAFLFDAVRDLLVAHYMPCSGNDT